MSQGGFIFKNICVALFCFLGPVFNTKYRRTLKTVPGQTGQRVAKGGNIPSNAEMAEFNVTWWQFKNITRGEFNVTTVKDGKNVTATGQEHRTQTYQTTWGMAKASGTARRPSNRANESVNAGCVPPTFWWDQSYRMSPSSSKTFPHKNLLV